MTSDAELPAICVESRGEDRPQGRAACGRGFNGRAHQECVEAGEGGEVQQKGRAFLGKCRVVGVRRGGI
jgi:hypothetical protein